MMMVMVLMVVMMLMMIPMMPGVMTMTAVTIPPYGREFPRWNLPARKVFSSLCRFRREEAAEKFYEVAPRSFEVKGSKYAKGQPEAGPTGPRCPPGVA